MAFYIVKPWYKKGGSVKVVPFSTGTDAEIAAMLDAYYNGELTWAEMGWAVGDTRKIHLNQFACPNPNSSYNVSAQEITCVIVDHDHTPLATSINGHTNACITVQFREALGDTYYDGKNGTIYVNGDSGVDYTFTKWSNLYMRTYINSTLLGAFSYSTDKGSGTSFKDMIKPSKHYRHTTYNGTASEEVTDTLFLPSYPEIFGTESYNSYDVTNPVEGTQFNYYVTASNRIKYNNNNGTVGNDALAWWLGSASSSHNTTYGYRWLSANTTGNCSYGAGTISRALAPAWAM